MIKTIVAPLFSLYLNKLSRKMRKIFTCLMLLSILVGNAQIAFEGHSIIQGNVPFGPSSVTLADFDGDGLLDILVSSDDDSSLSWFKNIDGNFNFGLKKLISNNEPFTQNALPVDLDGDGDNDILVAAAGNDTLSWFENTDGNGSFNIRHIVDDNLDFVYAVDSKDLDGDGDNDVVATSLVGASVVWYENTDGQGNFGLAQLIDSNASGVRDVHINDFDGDGDMDIISANNTVSSLIWYENVDGNGNFGNQHIVGNVITEGIVYTGDLDGDGDNDVVLGSFGNSSFNNMSWYENVDGLGDFVLGQVLTFTGSSHTFRDISMADLDGDSDLDIYIALGVYPNSGTGYAYWFENMDGDGTFGDRILINDKLDGARSIIAGDMDSDGDHDLVVGSKIESKVSVFDNENGQGSFSDRIYVNTSVVGINTVRLADIDGDSDLDAVCTATGDDILSWYENLDGLGDFGNQIIIENSYDGQFGLNLADIDGDGDNDLITAPASSTISWYENTDGLGTFGPENIINFAGSSGARDIKTADIDGDNDLDVLVCYFGGDSEVAWFENLDGLGTFGPMNIIYQDSLAWSYAADTADFDGDGDLDIAFVQNQGNKVFWAENLDGLGSFAAPTQIGNCPRAYYVSTGDIDGDSDMDMVVTSRDIIGDIRWYENLDGQGDFGFQQEVILADDLGRPSEVRLVDLDSDGDLDIVAAILEDNTTAYLINDGFGNFGDLQIVANNTRGVLTLDTGDIDGDGDIDILTGSNDDFMLAWHENNGMLNQIVGTVTLDSNLDGCDVLDNNIPNVLVTTDDGQETISTFTHANGGYVFYPYEGSYTTTLSLNPYFTSTPGSHSSVFTGLGDIDLADFCLEALSTANDLNISFYPITLARPGFEATYQLVYSNVGSTILSGSVELVFDENRISFVDASEPVTSQTSNSLTFDYTDLVPFEFRTITIAFDVAAPPTTENGDVLIFETTVNPLTNDETEEDNVFDLLQTVVGSFDPNDIQVLEGSEILIEQADEYLHYIIRFQNTGTASAINVIVTNELDPNLDWTTIQMQNVSHPYVVEITNGNQVEFIFDNINLPDSNTNEAESNGFIQYKIKPVSTVDIGDSMSNNANIYFDFNAPILTNTVTTTIVDELLIEESKLTTLSLFPNPSDEIVNIQGSYGIYSLKISNQIGQTLRSMEGSEVITSFSVHELSAGIYFVELKDEFGNSVIKKLVKQ